MYVADETTDDKFGSKLAKDRLDISVPGGSTFDVVTPGGVPHAATTMAAANAATIRVLIRLLRLRLNPRTPPMQAATLDKVSSRTPTSFTPVGNGLCVKGFERERC